MRGSAKPLELNSSCAASCAKVTVQPNRIVHWFNIATLIALGGAAIAFVTPPHREQAESSSGPRIGVALGIGGHATKTLVIVIQSDCVFCTESMPLYRRVIEQRNRNPHEFQVVVAASEWDSGIADYLAAHRVSPDQIVKAAHGVLPIRVTPALLLLDSNGRITGMWEGTLDATEEGQLSERLFGDADN